MLVARTGAIGPGCFQTTSYLAGILSAGETGVIIDDEVIGENIFIVAVAGNLFSKLGRVILGNGDTALDK